MPTSSTNGISRRSSWRGSPAMLAGIASTTHPRLPQPDLPPDAAVPLPGRGTRAPRGEGHRRHRRRSPTQLEHAAGTISDMAADYGIDFTLGIWMHRPSPSTAPAWWKESPARPTIGMIRRFRPTIAPGVQAGAPGCPAVTGVRYRMNHESGIPEDRQTKFFAAQFQALRDCGRPIRLEPAGIQGAAAQYDSGGDGGRTRPDRVDQILVRVHGAALPSHVEDRQMGRPINYPTTDTDMATCSATRGPTACFTSCGVSVRSGSCSGATRNLQPDSPAVVILGEAKASRSSPR